METQEQKTKPQKNNLSREITVGAIDEKTRKVEISFSSEEPYMRGFGYETLSHKDGAVDLSRLNNIGVLLFNHERDEVIGRIEEAWIEGKRGKARVVFDSDSESDKIFRKVVSGTLKGVSVGYSVETWEEQETTKGEPDSWLATHWTPYEISIVSVPADATVGVGRALEVENAEKKSQKEEEKMEENKIEEKAVEKIAPETDGAAAERAVVAERNRVAEIAGICRAFEIDPTNYIAAGTSVDATRAAILEKLKETKAPARVSIVEDAGDKLRAAATDALAMRSGTKVSKPAQGAEEMRGMSLKSIAIECLASENVASDAQLRRMSADELYSQMQRQFFNPTSAFPAILDAAIKKNIVSMYQAVPTTFEAWTSKGSVSDFKATPEHNYLIGGGSFEKVEENGELKASKPSTHLLPTRKIDTYGAQFTMSRQAFINDDIGFLSAVPARYAAAAKRKINAQVYEMLLSNSANIFDGKKLFCTDHKNVVTSGAAPSLAAINALMLKMQAQTDPFGEAINVVPRMLILPIGHGMTVDTILHSAQITTTDNAAGTGYNPLANRGLTYVEDATINTLAGSGAAPWFMVADAMSAKSIQVDYLNGQETPTIRRAEVIGQLGYVWDIFMDWGITAVDFRGIAKNAGVAVTL